MEQRWVRMKKVERMESIGFKKTDVTKADGALVLMEREEVEPVKLEKTLEPETTKTIKRRKKRNA